MFTGTNLAFTPEFYPPASSGKPPLTHDPVLILDLSLYEHLDCGKGSKQKLRPIFSCTTT